MWLVFDVNGVITHNVDFATLKKFCRLHKKSVTLTYLKYMLPLIPYQMGLIKGSTFWSFVFGKGGLEFAKKGYEQNTYKDKQIVSTIKELKKKGFQIAILSNSCDIMSTANEHNGHYALADKIFLSERIGKIKPNPTVFFYVTRELRARPSQCLLIDDSWYNVAGARLCGWKTIWFKDLRNFIEKVEKRTSKRKSLKEFLLRQK